MQLGNLAVQVTNLPSQVARAIPAALRAHEEADRARYASMRESPSLEARIGLCRTLGDLLNLVDLELRVSNSDQLVICVCCHSHVVGSQGVFRLDQDFPHLRAAIAAHVATTVHARAVADAAKKHKVMLQCTAACSPQLCVFSADHKALTRCSPHFCLFAPLVMATSACAPSPDHRGESCCWPCLCEARAHGGQGAHVVPRIPTPYRPG